MPGRRSPRCALALAGLLAACAGPALQLARPDDLPERVLFRTATQDFNREWYVALRDGRIWVKPNPESGRYQGDWQLLGESGLPQGCGLVRHGPPAQIVELSIDGIHLMALSDEGAFYRAENAMQDIRSWIQWEDRWGWPAGTGDGLRAEFSTERGWSVGDSNALDVEYYEDIRGVRHNVRLGVAHLYRLDESGRGVLYNDWWLPSDWSREICGPERGTLTMANLRVSASTIFVIGERGELYTRLWDFDTSGESDLLTYSYVNETPDDNIRALPAEDWRRQPDIDGSLTRRIAIYQTGKGNAARGLRVEGERAGQSGFFFKAITDEAWQFEATGHAIEEPFLDTEAADAAIAPDDRRLRGSLRREGVEAALDVEILDFNLLCSPAHVQLWHGDQPVTVAGQPLRLPLHHVQAMDTETRPRRYWEQGQDAAIRGALLIPETLRDIDDDAARAAALELLEERQVINLQGAANVDHLALTEIAVGTPFLVPLHEKGLPFNLFSLRARE